MISRRAFLAGAAVGVAQPLGAAEDTLAIGAGHGPVHHFYASW